MYKTSSTIAGGALLLGASLALADETPVPNTPNQPQVVVLSDEMMDNISAGDFACFICNGVANQSGGILNHSGGLANHSGGILNHSGGIQNNVNYPVATN
jgi:hypothetical protein